MPFQKFELKNKVKLAADIFELTYKYEKDLDGLIPGQFITFILPEIGGRAYSVLEVNKENKQIILVIKKWTKEMHGRGGSIILCNAEVGDSFNGVGPAGHFILKENDKNKLFMGTGTGFVPLYNQIVAALNKELKGKITFLFGVRETKGLFYINKLKILKEKFSNFDYKVYISREKSVSYEKGYITDFLNKETTDIFDEYYICGTPNMIESSISMLKGLNIDENNVFYEKY